jgi:hypothetical protein
MNRILFACVPLLLTACSAEVFVETEPMSQTVPVISLQQRVYVEVAIDIPPEAQGLDIIVQQITADLTVVNPTQSLTLEAGVRLSLEGTATPEKPVLYTNSNLPAYFSRTSVLLPTRDFAPQSRVPVTIDSAQTPALVTAAGKARIWIIVNNTVRRVGIGADTLPVNILLEDIIFRARVTKPFPGVGGGLEVGGL